MEEIDLDLLPEMGGADGGTVDLDSLPEITDNGEPSLGITETAQKDYEAATGAEAPQNPILAQIANMGLTVGGRLNANLQMQAAQKLAAGGNYDDRDMDDLMDQMVYGGVKKVNDAMNAVPSVVGPGAEMAMFFHRKRKQERVPNEILHDWDETEGKTYKDPDERRVARMEYARQIATDFIRERSAVRQNAETELKNREVTHTANVVSRGLGMLGYTAPYMMGPVGIGLQFLEEGAANAVGYANDEYGYDDAGRFRIVAEGDDAGRAALAGFGTAGIETATEIVGGKIGGALAKRGAKTLGRLVVGNKAAEAIGAGVGKLAGKTAEALGKTKVGRKTLAFAKCVGSVFKWTSRKIHLENPIEENIEEFEGQQANSLLGWDKRRSELENLTDENGKPIDGVGARWWHDTKQFLKPGEILKLNEAMLLTMGGGAAVAYFANRSARKYVDNIIRKHDLMSEEEINTASLEDKVNAYKAWAAKLNEEETARMIDEGTGAVDRLAERIAGSYGEKRKRVNALREKMAERDDYNNGIELDRLQIPRQKFNVPMRQDGRGRNVPDFRQVTVDDADTGEKAQRNAVYDESGISIVDNGGEGDAAYIVFSPDGRSSRDFPTLKQAVKFATQLKNAYALDLARDRMKQQFIANEYDENYRGSKSEIVDVKGVDEAVRLGIKLTGEDVSKDANFRRDRRGWRLKDGTVVLVRDNIASPGEVQRLMRHEIVGHDGRMMQGRWFESDEGSEIGRLRDANLEKTLKDGPVTGRETRRVLRETVANVVQQRRHSADTIDKVVHAVRNALRNRGVDLKMNDTDLEVEVSRIEKELRHGDGDTHISVDGTIEKQEFREAEQAEANAEEKKEDANETGNVRDEAPAQPEQGAAGPAGGGAARPVEAQPQGGEAPRHGAVKPAKTAEVGGVKEVAELAKKRQELQSQYDANLDEDGNPEDAETARKLSKEIDAIDSRLGEIEASDPGSLTPELKAVARTPKAVNGAKPQTTQAPKAKTKADEIAEQIEAGKKKRDDDVKSANESLAETNPSGRAFADKDDLMKNGQVGDKLVAANGAEMEIVGKTASGRNKRKRTRTRKFTVDYGKTWHDGIKSGATLPASDYYGDMLSDADPRLNVKVTTFDFGRNKELIDRFNAALEAFRAGDEHALDNFYYEADIVGDNDVVWNLREKSVNSAAKTSQPSETAASPNPVEAQPQGGEAPRHGAVKPAKTGSDAAEAPTEAPPPMKTDLGGAEGEDLFNRTQRAEPAAPRVAVFTKKDGTKEPIEGYVAPMEGDIAPKREVVVQHDTGGEINARQKILGTVKSISGDRVTVGYRDPWGNEQSDTFSRSEIVGVKPLPQTRENGPVSAPTEAGATTPPRAANPAEGRKSGDAAALRGSLTAETPAKPVAGGKMPKTLMVGGVPIENGFHKVTVEIEENGRTIRKSVTPEEAEAMGMVMYATLETKPAAPAPKAPKTPSVRMKDEAAERKAKAALDAIDFDTPDLDGLKSKIRNGTILTEADQRQFAEDVRKGRLRYPRFRADEIAASTGKEHGKLWQYILSLESARMDGRRARGGSEVYGRAASQVRRGGSEWGRVGTGSAQSPSVAYSPKYKKLDSGTESEVFDTGDGWVVKVRQIHPLSIGDVIDELAKVVYHNYLFPGEKYVLDDIVRHEHDGYREFYLILRQPFVTPKTENGRIVQPTYAQIWQLMKSRPQGFTFMDLSSRPAETGEYGDYSSSDGDEDEVVSAVKKVAYNRQFVVYDFQPGRNTFIDAKSGKVRFIDPRIDINDPGAGFRYSKYGMRRKFDGEVDFDTPELGVREKQTALSGGTSRNQNPSGNEYGRKWKIFRPGTRNVDIGAGRFDKATQFLADIGVENIPFDPVNRDGETNRRAAESVRANPADTATVHNVLNVIDNDSVMEGIVNQAARAIKKNGSAIFTIYEGNRSGVGARTRDGYQRNAKARSYEPTIKKFFGSVETHGNVILARRPKDIGPAFWAFDSSFENGINFDTPEFDPERFGKLVTGVGKLVDVLVESGHRDFKSLATYIYERDAEKYGRAKPVLQDIWNAVARARGLSRVGDAEAERVFGIIEAQEKEADDENVRRGVRGEVLAGEPAAGGGGSVGLVAGQSAAGGGDGNAGGMLAGGRVRSENPDRRVDGERPGAVPRQPEGRADSGNAEVPQGRGGSGRETSAGNGSVGDSVRSRGSELQAGADRAGDGDNPKLRVKKAAKEAADSTKPNPSLRDFVMTRSVEDAILEKNAAQRVRNNLDAIKLIRDLKARDYAATPEEQATLAKFVGWGGLREKVFGYALERAYDLERTGERDRAMSLLRRERVSQSAYDLHKELRSVLNDSEYESAKASASTAFYTPVDFVRVLHDALRNIGVKGGRFLGPSAGTGNFASAAGEYEKPVNWHFVEKDVMTGEMLKALFPNQRVTIGGFEETKFPDGFFDFAIDNVPYADVPISDRSLSSKMFKIHDYFFAKTLAKLRPGGVMAFLTSTGTLDKTSPILRQFLTEHGGKIVGAVRLPNGFFSENAGTDVASDLVVVQKVQGRPDNSAFEKGVEYGKTEEWVRRKGRIEKPLAYNGYFQNHPEQVIGTMEVASGQFGPTLKYTMPDGASMLEKVGNAVKNAFNGVDRDALLKSAAVAERQDHTPVYDKEGLRQGNVTMKDGKAFIKSGELLEPITLPNDRKLVNELKRRGRTPSGIMEGLLALRKAMRDVIDAQMSESDTVEADLAPLLANLNAVYDAFVQKNGTLHDRLISPFVLLDKADGNRMLALERVEKFKNEKTGKDESRIVKSDIFTKRVISRGQRATKADTPKDALVISYSESGAINVPRIAELLGVSGEETVKKLKEGGDAFENPQTGLLEPSWVYLSGRVRAKLAAARAAVEAGEESFRANVEALEKVQPPMVRLEDAEIKFGATWVDPECMKDFLRDAFGAENMRISLGRNEVTGQWNVEFGRVMNEDPWGETSWSPKEFVSRVLNHGSMNHYETDPSDKKRYLDERQTEANKLAAEKLHSAFSQFVQSSDKWAEPMYERYNAVMTDMVEIKLPNNVLPFRSAGMSEETLGKLFEGGDPNKPKNGREYQSAVIARGVLGGGSLCLAHCVGAGKTLEMQSIGVLGRHLGLFKKPMYVVPNHMLEQFTNEFVEAFPNANILKMAEADVKPANRRAFFAQVANGDWDAIVVKHSTFSKKLAMSDEYQKEFMEAQRKDLIEAIAAMREAGEKISVDQATKKLERLEAKLKKLANAENHDSQIVPFEELGVDQLFVDEAHNFKGMPITTRQGRTGGLSQGDSQRAEDMQMKTQYVQSLHGGDRGVVFATGTPLSNAPVVEAYVMLKYLVPNKLDEQGLKHFDDFVDAFGRITTESEFSTDGKTVKEKDKVSAFVNIPELMKLLRSAVDIVNSDQLDIPRPKPKYRMIDVDMSPAQEQIMEMVAREAAIPPTKEQRNKYLTLTRIAKNACLTPRLLGFEDGGNKIIRAVSEIKRVYDETTDNRGAQLVFTDIFNESEKTREMVDAYMAASDEKTRGVFESLARRGGKVGTYNLNEEIRDLLVAAGIPKEEIAIVQDIDKSKGDKDANKSALFAKVRSGEVRVLIGSRPKMGEGTNVQERLAAIHLLHPGWKPSEDEQAIGRIIRPGNTYKEGQIFYYLTKGNANIGSYETKNHQLIGVKSKLIDQVMHGDDSRREIDMDESAIDRDMLMGLASGNKALMELIDVKKRAHKLELNTESTLTSARRIKDKAEASGRILERKRGEFAQEQEGVKEWRDKNDGRPFALTTPDGRSVEKMKDMAELVSGEMTRLLTKDRYDRAERTVLGDFNGVELVLAFDRYGDEKFKLAVPLLGVEREINYSGFVPDFTTAAMTAFKGRILEAVSPDYAKAYENSLNDMDRQAKKMSADADKLQKDYEVMRGELIKLRTRQAQLEREVTPLVVQAVEDRKVAAYGNWLIAKPGGGQYVARRESDAKSLSAPTVKELIPLMDAEDFASPRNAATKTVDLRQRLKSDSKGETPMVSNIPVADVDFDTPELYTGSTADYERPSLHYVGTGEGSQVYGWGLYASNRRGVAESYAKAGVPRGDFSGENADVNFDTPELSPAEQAYAESEDKTPTEKVMREVYGMTNDEIATALKAAAMEPPKHVRKTDETAWMQAEELLSNPSYMAKLSSAVAKFPRNIADYENNALNVLFRRRQAEVNAAKEAADALKKTLDALNAIPKGERDADFGESLEAARREYGEAASRLAQAKALMHETGFALTRSSSEAGRRLRSNRGLIDQTDLSYAGISGRMATVLGGADKITPEMDARIREIAKEFASIDEEGRDLATARLKAHAEKIVEQIKRGDKMRKATERKPGDEAKRVMRNYNDAMAQIEVGAAEVGGTIVGLPDQQYPAWGKWLRAIGEFHCFENPDITEEECVRAIVEDISPFMDGVDENQVRDALTGFGHNFRQSRYDAQRLMNDLRSQARLKRQMDWMDETNTMPPLTGVVRDEPSDTTRNLQKQVQERKKEIPDEGRDARRLKGVLESAKTRVKNRIADLERAIETGERIPGRDRTVPEDIELRELKKRRDALQQSYDELFKTERGLTDEQRVKLAERLLGRELEHALEDLDRARSGDFSKRPKRPGVESPSIDALRDRLDEVREQIRELKKAKYEFGMTPDELDAYNARKMANREKALMRLADRIVNGDLRPQKKPQPPMPPEMQKRYDTMGEQMKKARQKLADMRLEAEIATWPLFWRKAGEYLRFSMTAQRALRATMDFSAVLRQAARITLAHPVMGVKAFGKAWNAAHSEANLLAVNDEIMSDPSIQEAVAKYGLHLREVDATSARDVEMFHGMERDKVRIFGKEVSITDIPFFGEFMLKSERHYITYLNAVSAELYSSIVNDRTRFPAGPTAWQKKMVADMINIWNGSAALPEERRQALQKAWINDILWAPQLAISRIQSAALYDVWHPLVAKGVKNAETGAFDAVSAEERKTMFKIGAAEHLKSSLAMIALGALLKWLFADEDDWYDFKRADWFEKLLMIVSPKVGNTTIDLTGGEQSVNRAAHKIWKLATSGKVRTGSGRMAEMGSYGGPTVWGVIGRYVQGKTSPWLSELVSLMEGRDYVGNEYTWKDAAIGAAVPLTFEDVKEQLEQNGIGKSLITIPLSLLGAGGSTYDRKVYENAVNPFMEAKKTYDAVTDDGDLDESERRDKLSRLKASNPLLVDGIRDRIASETATIRRLEANARKVAAIAGEPNADLEAEIARRKADLLKLIRDNR